MTSYRAGAGGGGTGRYALLRLTRQRSSKDSHLESPGSEVLLDRRKSDTSAGGIDPTCPDSEPLLDPLRADGEGGGSHPVSLDSELLLCCRAESHSGSPGRGAAAPP